MHMPVTFLYPWALTLVFALLPFIWLRRKRQSALGHSRVGMHDNLRAVTLLGRMPVILFSLSFIALVAALARPVLPESHQTRSIQARDILIAVDISYSMSGELPNPQQQTATNTPLPTDPTPPDTTSTDTTSGAPPQQPYRRLDAARDATVAFIQNRPVDRIGLMVFDTETYFHWPLSDDRKMVLRMANSLNASLGGGTNFEGPSKNNPGIGPIQASINHFRDYGQAKSKVLILVTDGEDSMSQERQNELAQQLQELGVTVYVLGVGEGWTNGSTPDLQKFAEKMNGKVFRVADAGAMQASFDQINNLEISRVELETTTTHKDIYILFVVASLTLLVLFLGSVVVTREDA